MRYKDINHIREIAYKMNRYVDILNDKYCGLNKPMYYYCEMCGSVNKSTWRSMKQNNCRCNTCNMIMSKIRMKNVYKRNKMNYLNIDVVKTGKVEIIGEYKGSREPIHTKCKICGNEWYPPYQHLKAGHACPKCGKVGLGWSRTNWIESAMGSDNFESYKVYIIKMYNEEESFYKIGITYNELKYRMKGCGYNYEVIKIIESDDGEYIWNLEKELHKKHKEYRYIPKKEFGGMYECFSKIIE